MSGEVISIPDLDGTVPGRAALIYVNLSWLGEEEFDPKTGLPVGPEWDLFIEGENCADPHLEADMARTAHEAEHPDHKFAIIVNPRAHYLAAKRVLAEIGNTLTMLDYLEMQKWRSHR
jgi:hypothetical protein